VSSITVTYLRGSGFKSTPTDSVPFISCVIFLSLYRQILESYVISYDNHFVAHPFQFITHQSFHHLTQNNLR
jgi:hypothetical protein